jgi:predicted dehydrogenase
MADAPRRLRLGMVGGGLGAFIGPVHRIAARLDGRYRLVAGALSSDPDRARASGREIGLEDDRSYADFRAMAEAEAARPDGVEVAAIVTPNDIHLPAATAFLERGIHVICDKPLATGLEEARDFAAFAKGAGARFFLTHNYSGYPMVRLMREMIARGDLGRLRIINVEYVQDWLAADDVHSKQAEWRADPARAGAGGALGDIGTHAYHLATYVTGLRAEELSADLQSFGAGRVLDDNAHIRFRFVGGVVASAWISQVAIGNENGLRLRVIGTDGALEFFQEDPNRLIHSRLGKPRQIVTRGGPQGAQDVRVPAGHPEGFLEGFATLYRDIADAILGDSAAAARVPSLADGMEGMAFVAAAVASHHAGGEWTALDAFR